MKTKLKLNIKKLDEKAVIPVFANPGDAGLDLVAISKHFDEQKGFAVYGTGLAIEIPKGYVGLLVPRSSISNYGLMLANHVGVIDSGYRGEIQFRFKPDYLAMASMLGELDHDVQVYEVGDKVGQLVIVPVGLVEINVVDELKTSTRGSNGFGSSGK